MSQLQLSTSAFQAASDEARQAMDHGDYTAAAALLSQLLQTLQLHEPAAEPAASAPASANETCAEHVASAAAPSTFSLAAQQKLLLSLAECHIHSGDPLKVRPAALADFYYSIS